MRHAHYRSWLLGISFLLLLATRPVFAISPSYIMFYGGQRAAAPVVLQVDYTVSTGFLWETRARRPDRLPRESFSKRLEGRAYLNFAVFWGQWNQPPTKPEAASQHGRLYLPTATEPAVVVVTFPDMQAEDPNARTPPAMPIPIDLEEHIDAGGYRIGFIAGWALSAEDILAAKQLGVPGLPLGMKLLQRSPVF